MRQYANEIVATHLRKYFHERHIDERIKRENNDGRCGKTGSGSLAGLVFLNVNKEVSQIGLTVLKLKLNQEIEVIGIRGFIFFHFMCMILSFEFRCCCCRICFLVVFVVDLL